MWAGPLHVIVRARVRSQGGKGGSAPCGRKPESGRGAGPRLEGATLGQDLPRVLEPHRGCYGKAPWCVERGREAHAGDLAASPPFDLLASLERLPPPHPGAAEGGLARAASGWAGQQGWVTLGCRKKLLSPHVDLPAPASLSRSLHGPAPLCHKRGEGFVSCRAGSGTHRWGSGPTLTPCPWFCLHSSGSTLPFLCPPLSASAHRRLLPASLLCLDPIPGVLRTWAPQQFRLVSASKRGRSPAFGQDLGMAGGLVTSGQVQREKGHSARQSWL